MNAEDGRAAMRELEKPVVWTVLLTTAEPRLEQPVGGTRFRLGDKRLSFALRNANHQESPVSERP